MNKRTYQDLANIYREMYMDEEEVKKLRRREMRKGEGLNNYGGVGYGKEKKNVGSSDDVGKNTGGAAGFAGKGKFANNTPWTGAGAQKPSGSDKKRASKYKDQLRKDRESERGISDSDRRERARANKEKKAKAGIDSLLKDIRGK
jgi:hypothetical protein